MRTDRYKRTRQAPIGQAVVWRSRCSFTDRFGLQTPSTARAWLRPSINPVFMLVLQTGLVKGHWHDPSATHGYPLATKPPTLRWLRFGTLVAQPSTTRWSAPEPQQSNATNSKPAWQFWKLGTNWWSQSLIGSAELKWK